MRSIVIGALGVIALAQSGCATLNSPEAFQNAAAQQQECKVVALHSASDSLRLQNQKGRDGDAMEQTEGSLDIGRVKAQDLTERTAFMSFRQGWRFRNVDK